MRLRLALGAALAALTAMVVPSQAWPLPVDTPQAAITWGGMEWLVVPTGPNPAGGPVSNSSSAVWVDAADQLHMRFVPSGSTYAGPSLLAATAPSYGTYRWTVDQASVTGVDRCAVVGLFLYGRDKVSGGTRNREIDIENSKFCAVKAPNSQFVVQPYYAPGHITRFNVPRRTGTLTEQFTWLPGSVSFDMWTGPQLTRKTLIRAFAYSGVDTPNTLGTLLRMNFWLAGGRQPLPTTPHEVVLKSFSYTPAPTTATQPLPR